MKRKGDALKKTYGIIILIFIILMVSCFIYVQRLVKSYENLIYPGVKMKGIMWEVKLKNKL